MKKWKGKKNSSHLSEIAFITRSAPASLQGVVPQTITWYCPILDLFCFVSVLVSVSNRGARKKKECKFLSLSTLTSKTRKKKKKLENQKPKKTFTHLLNIV